MFLRTWGYCSERVPPFCAEEENIRNVRNVEHAGYPRVGPMVVHIVDQNGAECAHNAHHAHQRSDARTDDHLAQMSLTIGDLPKVARCASNLSDLYSQESGVILRRETRSFITGRRTLRRAEASHPGDITNLSPELHRPAACRGGYEGQRDMTVGGRLGIPRGGRVLHIPGGVYPPWYQEGIYRVHLSHPRV